MLHTKHSYCSFMGTVRGYGIDNVSKQLIWLLFLYNSYFLRCQISWCCFLSRAIFVLSLLQNRPLFQAICHGCLWAWDNRWLLSRVQRLAGPAGDRGLLSRLVAPPGTKSPTLLSRLVTPTRTKGLTLLSRLVAPTRIKGPST